MTVVPLAVFGAAGLAMVGAIFGVGLARLVWADDLKHAQRLREIWDRTQVALESTIESQKRQIEILEHKR